MFCPLLSVALVLHYLVNLLDTKVVQISIKKDNNFDHVYIYLIHKAWFDLVISVYRHQSFLLPQAAN